MFSKKNKLTFKSTSFRLALGFSILFAISSLIFFISVYFFFFRSLKDTDRTLVRAKLNEYSTILQNQGVNGLQSFFSRDRDLHLEARFSLRVADRNNRTILFRMADNLNEFNRPQLQSEFEVLQAQNEWSYITARNGDELEILNEPAGDSFQLQVGKSTSERQDLLERATEVFLIATLLAIIIGAVGGYWFSKKTLRPLRELVSTTKAISRSNLDQRVKDNGSNDEFSELVQVFNSMLDRIQNLVHGMRDSLDSIAHDIKTPMTRLKAVADMTLSREQASASESIQALEECSESSGEILSLLNSLLDIYEADSGAMKLQLDSFDLSEMIDEVNDLYEIIAEDKNIRLVNLVSKDFRIVADRRRLKQAVANLIDNALKYSPANTQVEIRSENAKDHWRISIKDQGLGISNEDLPHIWDRLYRADQSRSEPGSGLGLSLVKAIVQAHGGTASLESQLKQGSTFYFQLPKRI